MPRGENPYYNSSYADSAGKISEALFGNPEKAGQIAYHRSQARLADSKADRQGIENNALTGGLAAALEAAGSDPNMIAGNMGGILQTMAAAGIENPGNFTAPWWAIAGESQSGASPAEALVRAAYAGKGTAIPTDLALTPERQDAIRNDKQAAVLERALATAGAKPGSGGKGPKIGDIDAVLDSVLGAIPGATYTDQYSRTQVEPDVMNYLAESGMLERMRGAAVDSYGAGGEASRQAVIDALGFEPGTSFDPQGEVIDPPGFFNKESRPAFVTRDGAIIDVSRALEPPPDPTGPNRDAAIMELRRRGVLK